MCSDQQQQQQHSHHPLTQLNRVSRAEMFDHDCVSLRLVTTRSS